MCLTCDRTARVLHRHLEVALRIGQSGANERDLSAIYDVLRLPLALALRPELDTADTPALAEARGTWAELFGTLHRHALLGGADRASTVVEDLAQRLLPLPLPANTQALPLWWLLAAQAARLMLEAFTWTKAHRGASPRKGGGPQRGEDMLRVAGEATELAAGLLASAPADAARLLSPVQAFVQGVPSTLFGAFRAAFLPHWSRAAPPLLSSPAFSAISGPFGGVWEAVLDALRRAPTSTYDTSLLNAYAVILREGFVSPERAIRSPTIEAWNASFGRVASRDVALPPELVPLLQSLRRKANILLPKHLFPADAPAADELLPPTPDEDMHVDLPRVPDMRGVTRPAAKDADKARREEQEKKEEKKAKREVRSDKDLIAPTLPPPSAATSTRSKGGQAAYVPVPPPPAAEAPKTEKQKEARKRKADVPLYSRLDPSSLDAPTQEAAELDPRKAHAQATTPQPAAAGGAGVQPAQNASAVDTPQQQRGAGSVGGEESAVQQLARIAEQRLEGESPETLHAILRHSLAIASKVAPLIKPARLSVVSQYY